MLTPDNYLICIGAAIREARKAAGWKQVELAVACDLQRSYIVEIEAGDKRKLSLLNFVKIAEVLELPLSALVSRAEALSEEQREG